MHCETGLHIGAGKGSLEIGGADNPVVKDAFGLPYIPGSSLRGRLRSLLEQTPGLAVPTELVYLSKRKGQEVRIHQSDRPDDEICLLFGRNPGPHGTGRRRSASKRRGYARAPTVYDAPLIVDSITPQMRENLDDELTEVKSENAVDRITSQANPRTLERVPAGARFRVRMVLDVLCAEDKPLLARVAEGLAAARRRCPRRRRQPRQRPRQVRLGQACCGAAKIIMQRERRRRRCSKAPILRLSSNSPLPMTLPTS